MMLIGTVALRSVSREVQEAAGVDGATGWRLWSNITWPLVKPSVMAGVLLRGALLFNAFQIPLMLFTRFDPNSNTTLSVSAYFTLRRNTALSNTALLDTVGLGVAVLLIWLYNRQTCVVEGVQYV